MLAPFVEKGASMRLVIAGLAVAVGGCAMIDAQDRAAGSEFTLSADRKSSREPEIAIRAAIGTRAAGSTIG
jgi:hypothetical protein